MAKENLRLNRGLAFEDALRNERRAGERRAATEDHHEGLRAVQEKRDPVFAERQPLSKECVRAGLSRHQRLGQRRRD